MKESITHVYTAKRKVLLTINQYDWNVLDILVFNHIDSFEAEQPKSYEELVELLKDYDKVYSFNKVETIKHGAVAFDIILNK